MTNSSRGSSLIDELEKTVDDVYGWENYRPIEKKIADIKFEVLKNRVGDSYVGSRFTVSVIERGEHLAMIDSRDVPIEPLDIFPESENRFFDLEDGTHEFNGEEYMWTPRGGNSSVTFKKLLRN